MKKELGLARHKGKPFLKRRPVCRFSMQTGFCKHKTHHASWCAMLNHPVMHLTISIGCLLYARHSSWHSDTAVNKTFKVLPLVELIG